jgi:hypothetical protein
MVNRPKAIGTAAETAVVRAARRHGFPGADRLTLTGRHDRGDVGLCPGVILEVKGGETARNASDALVESWLDESSREAFHASADVAFLVVQRRGVGAPNAHRWWAWWRLGWLEHLRAPETRDVEPTPVRMQLGHALRLLRAAGYGDPLMNDTDVNVSVHPAGRSGARDDMADNTGRLSSCVQPSTVVASDVAAR